MTKDRTFFCEPARWITALLLLLLSVGFATGERQEDVFSIPAQTLRLYELTGDLSDSSALAVPPFEISRQVSFRAYKAYLTAVERDSSRAFYLSQLPDSGIGSREVYRRYLESDEYDAYPVLGISWDNAMNFCRWKTLTENTDSIRLLYRLPCCSEWLSALTWLSENRIRHDLNGHYADWLIGSRDESNLSAAYRTEAGGFVYDRLYFHTASDPPVMKRKQVIGNCYMYQQPQTRPYNFSFYSYEGYKQVAFRYVKERVPATAAHTPGQAKASAILTHWGLSNR